MRRPLLSPKWGTRVVLALGFWATTYAAHVAIHALRVGSDWIAAFAITLTLLSGITHAVYVIQTAERLALARARKGKP